MTGPPAHPHLDLSSATGTGHEQGLHFLTRATPTSGPRCSLLQRGAVKLAPLLWHSVSPCWRDPVGETHARADLIWDGYLYAAHVTGPSHRSGTLGRDRSTREYGVGTMEEDDHGDAGDRWVGATPSGGLCGVRPVRALPGSFLDRHDGAVSPDGQLGLCGGAREPARLRELATGTLLRELGDRDAGEAGVATDGRRVLASGQGKFMKCTMTGRASTAVLSTDTFNSGCPATSSDRHRCGVHAPLRASRRA